MKTYNYNEIIERRSTAMNKADEVVRSFYRVRQALGYLGLFLPFALIFCGLFTTSRIEPSVSDFFHTVSRDLFVGTMCTIGVFLITYQGYDRQPDETLSDNWLSTVAGVSAFGVALFPNESPTGQVATLSQHFLGIEVSPIIHYSSALVFFYCLGHFCFFKFGKTNDLKRRRIYFWCGWVILVSGVTIGVASWLKHQGSPAVQTFVVEHNVVFWVEVAGIWAFALSWLVKGRGDMAIIEAAKKAARKTPANSGKRPMRFHPPDNKQNR